MITLKYNLTVLTFSNSPLVIPWMAANLSIIAPSFSRCSLGAHAFSIHIDASIFSMRPRGDAKSPLST